MLLCDIWNDSAKDTLLISKDEFWRDDDDGDDDDGDDDDDDDDQLVPSLPDHSIINAILAYLAKVNTLGFERAAKAINNAEGRKNRKQDIQQIAKCPKYPSWCLLNGSSCHIQDIVILCQNFKVHIAQNIPDIVNWCPNFKVHIAQNIPLGVF